MDGLRYRLLRCLVGGKGPSRGLARMSWEHELAKTSQTPDVATGDLRPGKRPGA